MDRQQASHLKDIGKRGSSLDEALLNEIPAFENFLHNIGFKRNEGAIFGLLVLSHEPLSSEDIEQTLDLSQSAVSQALKKLALYGAIETKESRSSESLKRIKYHQAKEDSLSIVASLFKKREQESIQEFKSMAQRVIQYKEKIEDSKKNDDVVLGRMNSIISTCELAEAVIKFVMEVSHYKESPLYQELTHTLPKLLNRSLSTLQTVNDSIEQSDQIKKFTHLLNETIKPGLPGLKSKLPLNKVKEGLLKLAGDHHVDK